MQQNRIYVNGAPHRFWIPPKDAASVVQEILLILPIPRVLQTLSGLLGRIRLVL